MADADPVPGEHRWLTETRTSYDTDAPGYARQVRGLLGDHPHLRAHLDVLVALVRRDGGGPVLDIGCGPGYVTRYLCDSGAEAFGIDLSPAMIAIARRDYPELSFEAGSMTNLGLGSRSLAGIVAFWSSIHIPDSAMPGVISEFQRVLRPGGHVLIGFHVGEGVEHTSEGYTGRSIGVDTHLRRIATVSGWLRAAAFRIESETIFRPDDGTPGAIVLARSPT